MAPHGNSNGKKDPLRAIFAGGVTGMIEISITYPTEFIKTYMQLYPSAGKNVSDIVKLTREKAGILGIIHIICFNCILSKLR